MKAFGRPIFFCIVLALAPIARAKHRPTHTSAPTSRAAPAPAVQIAPENAPKERFSHPARGKPPGADQADIRVILHQNRFDDGVVKFGGKSCRARAIGKSAVISDAEKSTPKGLARFNSYYRDPHYDYVMKNGKTYFFLSENTFDGATPIPNNGRYSIVFHDFMTGPSCKRESVETVGSKSNSNDYWGERVKIKGTDKCEVKKVPVFNFASAGGSFPAGRDISTIFIHPHGKYEKTAPGLSTHGCLKIPVECIKDLYAYYSSLKPPRNLTMAIWEER